MDLKRNAAGEKVWEKYHFINLVTPEWLSWCTLIRNTQTKKFKSQGCKNTGICDMCDFNLFKIQWKFILFTNKICMKESFLDVLSQS